MNEHLDETLTALWAQELDRCADPVKGPAYWAFNYVSTKDEHDPDDPVKLIPDKEYLKRLLHTWHTGEDIQFVVKSRQLMVSWLMCAYACWVARFQPHRLVLFQSKKFEDAAKMVFFKYPSTARCSFIEHHLPAWMKVCLGEKGKWLPVDVVAAGAEGSLTYPNGSRIEAIPEGPSQIEGRVPSLFLNDEASLQGEWRAGHSASLPCLVGGTKHKGKGITVATMRMPSDFSDECEQAGAVDPDGLMTGMSEFRSKSGVYTSRVHYSADPDKNPSSPQGKEWIIAASAGYRGGIGSVEWQSHMEINPQSLSGERVVPYWHEIKDRVVIDPMPYEQWGMWKLDSGLDYGARNPTVWLVFANDYEGTRYLAHELSVPANEVGGIAGYCELMKSHDAFPVVNGRIQADPSLWNKDQNTASGLVSKAQIFAENGVYLVKAQTKGQEADEVMINRLHGHYWSDHESDDFEPKLQIFRTCRKMLAAIPLWLYQDWRESVQGERSLKEKMVDSNVDEFDAMKYVEVSRPQPASRSTQAPVGSIKYLRNLILKQRNSKKRSRS